jgi:hypothetical protein
MKAGIRDAVRGGGHPSRQDGNVHVPHDPGPECQNTEMDGDGVRTDKFPARLIKLDHKVIVENFLNFEIRFYG